MDATAKPISSFFNILMFNRIGMNIIYGGKIILCLITEADGMNRMFVVGK